MALMRGPVTPSCCCCCQRSASEVRICPCQTCYTKRPLAKTLLCRAWMELELGVQLGRVDGAHSVHR